MSEKALTDLGLSSNESKVYLTLLKLGSTTAGEIAKKSKVYRTNAYEALNRLLEKGLVSFVYQGHQKFYEAESPEKIINILEEKKERFNEVLPKLLSEHKSSQNKSVAHVYKGVGGIKSIYAQILKEKKDYISFGAPKMAVTVMGPFYPSFDNKRLSEKIKLKAVFNDELRSSQNAKALKSYQNTELKFLPPEFNIHTITLVFGDKTAVIVFGEEPIATLIEDHYVADSFREYFNVIWNISKP